MSLPAQEEKFKSLNKQKPNHIIIPFQLKEPRPATTAYLTINMKEDHEAEEHPKTRLADPFDDHLAQN